MANQWLDISAGPKFGNKYFYIRLSFNVAPLSNNKKIEIPFFMVLLENSNKRQPCEFFAITIRKDADT